MNTYKPYELQLQECAERAEARELREAESRRRTVGSYAERVRESWRAVDAQAKRLREDGDEEQAARIERQARDLYGGRPGGSSATRLAVEGMADRERERSRSRRRLDPRDVAEENESRRRAGLPPADRATLELAAQMAGTVPEPRGRRRHRDR